MVVTNETVTGTTATLTVIRANNGDNVNTSPAQDLPSTRPSPLPFTVGGSIFYVDGAINGFSLDVGSDKTIEYHGLTFTAQV